jgi:hypothetical protein
MRRLVPWLAPLLALGLAAPLQAAAPKSPWAGYNVGSFVKTKTVTTVKVGSHKVETVTDITQTVVDVRVGQATVETVASMNGVPRPSRTRSEVSLLDASPAPAKVPGKSGSESLTVGGRVLRCEWTEAETDMAGNRTMVRTWTSPQVPGGLVKTISRNVLMDSILEVVAFEVK